MDTEQKIIYYIKKSVLNHTLYMNKNINIKY